MLLILNHYSLKRIFLIHILISILCLVSHQNKSVSYKTYPKSKYSSALENENLLSQHFSFESGNSITMDKGDPKFTNVCTRNMFKMYTSSFDSSKCYSIPESDQVRDMTLKNTNIINPFS